MTRIMAIYNPFRQPDRRRVFEACVETFYSGGFRNPNGTPNRGGAHKIAFWNGYHGIRNLTTPTDSLGFAAYRAGQACRAHDDSNAA